MNKISYPQLVKDIADAYRNAIGSTDPITIGELANKVGETISRGNSIHYKSITYNEDNTITLIDNNDIEHTISCIYEDEKIVSIVLDSEEIKLSYDGDNLIAVEDTVINLSKVSTSSNIVCYNAPEIKSITVGKYDDVNPTRLTCVVQGSNDWYYRSFLDYDLSGIPQGSKILSAKLYLYLDENAYDLGSNFKQGYTWIGKITSQWDETIKWATQPSFIGEYGQYSDCKKLRDDNIKTWIYYDVTSLVQELLDDAENNYGLTIVNGNEGEYEVCWLFRNRRYTEKHGEDYSTYIEIYYE